MSESHTTIESALAEVERRWPGSFWHLAKGRVHSDEPMYGFQVLFGTDEILAEGCDHDWKHRRIYGDEIHSYGGRRDLWTCIKCGKRKTSEPAK